MNKINRLNIIDECRKLRKKGISIGEIARSLNAPKTTVYGYVKDILITVEQKKKIEERRKLLASSRPNPRKGKCIPGREIIKPNPWSDELIHIVAHFMFDGRVSDDGCIYYSKDKYQINHMRELLFKIFRIKPKIHPRDNSVYGLAFYHVEFANYIKNRKDNLFSYLNNGASKSEKKTFLKAFFDDEGSVYYKDDKRRVRGYQNSRLILEQIKKILRSFGIESKINKEGINVEVSGRMNLIRFSKEINFSSKIYINPKRKNGIWKKRISKREILGLLLSSYQKINKAVH